MTYEPVARFARLSVVALLLACGSDSPTEPADALAGTWTWVESTGGLLSQTRTPATEGFEVRLLYDGHGRVRAFRGSSSAGTASYTLTELPTAGPLPVYEVSYDPPLEAFPFDVLDTHTFRFTEATVARLEDACCDRWVHTIRRSGGS